MNHLARAKSDPNPLLISTDPDPGPRRLPFWFHQFWLRHPSIVDVVRKAWHNHSPMPSSPRLSLNLDRTAPELRRWNLGNFLILIKKALTRLQALQVEIGNASRPNLAKLKEEVEVRKYYNKCLLPKSILWRQKSRVDWLKEGDRNIKFSIFKPLTAEAGIVYHN